MQKLKSHIRLACAKPRNSEISGVGRQYDLFQQVNEENWKKVIKAGSTIVMRWRESPTTKIDVPTAREASEKNGAISESIDSETVKATSSIHIKTLNEAVSSLSIPGYAAGAGRRNRGVVSPPNDSSVVEEADVSIPIFVKGRKSSEHSRRLPTSPIGLSYGTSPQPATHAPHTRESGKSHMDGFTAANAPLEVPDKFEASNNSVCQIDMSLKTDNEGERAGNRDNRKRVRSPPLGPERISKRSKSVTISSSSPPQTKPTTMDSSTDPLTAQSDQARSRPTTPSNVLAAERAQEATLNHDVVDMEDHTQDRIHTTANRNIGDSVESGECSKEDEVNIYSQSMRGLNLASASHSFALSPAVQHAGSRGQVPDLRQWTDTQNKHELPDAPEKRVINTKNKPIPSVAKSHGNLVTDTKAPTIAQQQAMLATKQQILSVIEEQTLVPTKQRAPSPTNHALPNQQLSAQPVAHDTSSSTSQPLSSGSAPSLPQLPPTTGTSLRGLQKNYLKRSDSPEHQILDGQETPTRLAQSGATSTAAPSFKQRVIWDVSNPDMIDLCSDSDEEDSTKDASHDITNLAQHLGKVDGKIVHQERPTNDDRSEVEPKIEVINLCSESDGGSSNDLEYTKSRHDHQGLHIGREEHTAQNQAALNQGAKSGPLAPPSQLDTRITSQNAQMQQSRRRVCKERDYQGYIQPFIGPQLASKPITPSLPPLSTASQNIPHTADSVIGQAHIGSGVQASQTQYRAPNTPSPAPVLANPVPRTDETKQQTCTPVVAKGATDSQTHTALAQSNQSTGCRSHQVSAPQLRTLAPTQADRSSKQGHPTLGSRTAGNHSLSLVPRQITPMTTHVSPPAQGNRSSGLQTQPKLTTALNRPVQGEPNSRQANPTAGFFKRRPTEAVTQRASAALVRTNAGKVPRATNSQASQRKTPHFYASGPRDPHHANYYHDNTRDRQFPGPKPTEEQRRTAYGHDPKGRSC